MGDSQFRYPDGVAVAPGGDVYVSDTVNHRVQRFTSAGGFVSKWGTWGLAAGEFNNPFGIAVAPDNSIYISDFHNHRIQKFPAAQ
jgi:DNA-binding beta-propeller fold protein YncE